jgi:L-2-hydroxyglutarate oxidase
VKPYDIIVVGGGIVGVAAAWQVKARHPSATVLLVEKEPHLAFHQTGRNSGVIHAGVYYAPGSLKAEFCKRGAAQTIAFCREHGLPYEQCGKLLVATDGRELERMDSLAERCRRNGITTHRLNRRALRDAEPHIVGCGALLVPATGITDYRRITRRMAALFAAQGGEMRFGAAVHAIAEDRNLVRLRVGAAVLKSRYLVVCGGLGADRLARMAGIAVDFRIVPFRGEYFRLPAHRNNLVRHLIYPIPDPELPFLGVHLTRMIDGAVTVGPNAVLGWKREGYGAFNFSGRDVRDLVTFPGLWRVLKANWRSGLGELIDSYYKPGYLQRIRKYCPLLQLADLLPHPVGVRAQAVKRDGQLVHDFLFAETPRSLHVCNAPSPAATSAIPIGEHIVGRVTAKFKL